MNVVHKPIGVTVRKVGKVFQDRLFLISLAVTLLLNGIVTLSLLANFGLFRHLYNTLAVCICFLILGLFSLSPLAHNDGFFMVVGFGYGFVGISSLVSRDASLNLLDNNSGRNVALQIGLTGRFIEIIAFLVALSLAKRSFRGWTAPLCTLGGFILLQTLFFSLILWWDIFPDCLNENGATQFRRIMEGICLALFLVIFLLIIYRHQTFSINVFVYLECCLVLRMITSVFNVIIDDFDQGVPLIFSYLFRLLSLTYLFLSIGLSTFINPMESLFKNLDVKHRALESEKVVVTWMIEQVPAITILLNETGHITHMNRFSMKMLEFQELTPQSFFDLFHFEEDEDAYKRFKALTINKLPNNILHLRSIRTKTEDNRIIEWTLKRVKTSTNVSTNPSSRNSKSDVEMQSHHTPQSSSTFEEDSAKMQILCLGQDITDKMERENLLDKARSNAEKLSQMKDSFVANVSHELRTPLNCIIGVTDLLQQMPLAEPQREMMSMIKISANSLLSLINDLLDLAKIKHKGQIELSYGPIDLHSFLESCMMSVAMLSQTSQVEFAYRITKDCPRIIHNDEKRLRQILFNLLSNAIKFTIRGQIVVKVQSIIGPTMSFDGLGLEFSVIDSGIGIKSTDLRHLFDQFFQGHQGESKRQGTGIGLAITKRLIELMGGNIWVTSEVGVGTTFRFVIPLRDHSIDENSHPRTIQQHLNDNVDDDKTQFHSVLFCLRNRVVSSLLAETLSEDYGFNSSSFETLEDLNKYLNIEREPPTILTVVVEREEFKRLDIVALERVQKVGAQIQVVCVLSMSDYVTPSDADFPNGFRVDIIRKIIQTTTLIELLKGVPQKQIRNSDIPVMETPKNDPLESLSSHVHAQQKKDKEVTDLTILVVEDNATNRKVMKLMLDQIGNIHYDMAENGQVAVNLFLEKRYDCIFMDCQMPVLDGMEATREIRRIESERTELGRTHVTALTANAFADEKERCFDVGMDDYITKPINLKTITTKLDQIRAKKK